MRIIKTIGSWIAGTIIITIGIYFAVYGSLEYGSIQDNREATYNVQNVLEIYENCGYEVDEEGEFVAQSDDSYFFLPLQGEKSIKDICLDVDVLDNIPIQIYYATTHEMKGNQYLETTLTSGINKIDAGGTKASWLRFDLTKAKGEKIKLKSISFHFNDTKFVDFCIYWVCLVLIYFMLTGYFFNRTAIKRWINSNEKRKQRVELLDQICALAVSDFRSRFSGSYLGVFWGIVQPLSTILLFWFVFQVGFRSAPVDDVPFILWLTAGMIPWNYFYDAWFGGTNAFTSYSYIVKKVVFKVEYLPLVKVLSSTILNLIFNGILIIIYCLYRRFIGVHVLDMLYFSFCFFVLTLALSYITATLNVFMKDVGQFMSIALQILMWLTPMMWSYTMLTGKLRWIYLLNPLHYVINGYRESLIYGHWFFYQWKQMIWFWCFTLICYALGKHLMYKLKDHFADVL